MPINRKRDGSRTIATFPIKRTPQEILDRIEGYCDKVNADEWRQVKGIGKFTKRDFVIKAIMEKLDRGIK